MDQLLDIFSGEAFSLTAMTKAVISMDYSEGALADILEFEDDQSPTPDFTLDKEHGEIYVLPALGENEPAPEGKRNKRTAHKMPIPRYAEAATMPNREFMAVRQTGNGNPQIVEMERDKRLMMALRRLAKTEEWIRFGAMTGVIYDANRTDVLVNLRTELGVDQQATATWNLSAASFNTNEALTELKEQSEDSQGDFNPDDYVLVCGRNAFKNIRKHKSTVAAFSELTNLAFLKADDRKKGFVLSSSDETDVRLVSYGKERGNDGNPFLAANKAYFCPKAPGLWNFVSGPTDIGEFLGAILPFYTAKEPMEYNKGLKALVEMYRIAYCARPGSVIEVTINP
ncbi:major capsid protein [Pelagibacterium sp.]|uniref:major capsid protein n=1 Tax=Pelagibacterium sp. TaxID=1967288 RepID=UPI003A95D754